MRKKLKLHYRDHSQLDPRTLCGKEIDAPTGSPLNSDGTVPSTRVTTRPRDLTCKTCLAAFNAAARQESTRVC